MVCLYLRFKGVHMPWASCLRAENFQLVYLFSQKKKNILTVVLVLFHIVELEVKKIGTTRFECTNLHARQTLSASGERSY
jgi:hypothetical protein